MTLKPSGAWALLIMAPSGPAFGVPGPDTVAVVANSTVAESVDLARTYAEARNLPERQVCLLDLPTGSTISLEDYRSRLELPLEACLRDGGVLDRIEAVVVVKGVPLRVTVPAEDGDQRASLAAVLAAWKSTTTAGEPLVGQPPGVRTNCGGTPCVAAQWSNPFRDGTFEPGWTRTFDGVVWRPLIVTMLNARTYRDAARLVASATTAEAQGPRGQFLFMRGANGPRAVLDNTFTVTRNQLEGLGFQTDEVDFQSDLSGRRLAAFFTGTQTLGDAIEGNVYEPGALVDNLTSLGAVPPNFEAAAPGETPPESQVSISRWVEQGAAGVHGCTDEPLNNVFPSRRFVVDYAEGGTLGEAYFRWLPFAYWRNLVLGDPMAAPYATRPTLTVSGLADGDTINGSRQVEILAFDDLGRGIERTTVYVDGVQVEASSSPLFTVCVEPPVGRSSQVLVVAQAADDGGRFGKHKPKGWVSFQVTGTDGPTGCPVEPMDMGAPDMVAVDRGVPDSGMAPDAGLVDFGPADGGDAGDAGDVGSAPTEPRVSEGCRCIEKSHHPAWGPFALGMLAVLWTWRRRQHRN